MKLEQACVKAFHERMKVSPQVPFPTEPREKCLEVARLLKNVSEHLESQITDDSRLLRLHLMVEELGELSEALGKCDEVTAFDGLCDLLYVVLGTAATYDWPADLGFAEVHTSNMTKEKQPDDPSAERVRQKGPNYKAPDLAAVLARWRSRAAQPDAHDKIMQSIEQGMRRQYIYVGHLDADKRAALEAML